MNWRQAPMLVGIMVSGWIVSIPLNAQTPDGVQNLQRPVDVKTTVIETFPSGITMEWEFPNPKAADDFIEANKRVPVIPGWGKNTYQKSTKIEYETVEPRTLPSPRLDLTPSPSPSTTPNADDATSLRRQPPVAPESIRADVEDIMRGKKPAWLDLRPAYKPPEITRTKDKTSLEKPMSQPMNLPLNAGHSTAGWPNEGSMNPPKVPGHSTVGWPNEDSPLSVDGTWQAECGPFTLANGRVTHVCKGESCTGTYHVSADLVITIRVGRSTVIRGRIDGSTIHGHMSNSRESGKSFVLRR